MKKVNLLLDKYGININKYSYKNNAIIISSDKGDYVLKKKKRDDKKEIFDYLSSRGFSSFLFPINNFDDDYEIYDFLTEVKTLNEEKAIHLIDILSELQIRTTTYKEFTLDEIKEIYEEKKELVDFFFQYYNELEEVFSNEIYPAPYQYLLLNNVSKIYNSLQYSKMLIEEWYSEITKNKKRRIVLLHNHLTMEHFIDSDKTKASLINFDYSKYGSPIYDFIIFYKKHYSNLDMNSLFNIYQHRYPYTKEELLLLFIELIIPNKINLNNNVCKNTLVINELVNYTDMTREFILKQEKKYKKEDKEKFNQK